METRLASWIKDTPEGRKADEILRACVHCGFCLATCPTYQLLGDELDSPRGRIYQIKQVLEGASPTRETQVHLDRCLTCRSCETTCPSGVKYGQLVDIGRAVVDERVRRPWLERAYRWFLREGVSRPWLFGTGLKLARTVRWVLPPSLRAKIGARPAPTGNIPTRAHSRKVLVLKNCVQTSMLPSIDAATARVLDAIGVQVVVAPRSGCCGAIRQHLEDQAGARDNFRRNIDAWWPFIESKQVEAILINASGCGVMVKEYGHLLREDAAYAHTAQRIAEMTRDLAEFIPDELTALNIPQRPPRKVAFHPPCTLQHGLKIRGKVESLLASLGAELVPVRDAHICCGSAGTYSLLQPQLSQPLRAQKLDALLEHGPEEVLSANIGCISHLQSGTGIPVRHWIEWVDAHMSQIGKKA
jgi:glycolate oxidase iron-sulfur subunit